MKNSALYIFLVIALVGCNSSAPDQPEYQPKNTFEEKGYGSVIRFLNGAEILNLTPQDKSQPIVSFSAFTSSLSIPAGHYTASAECRDRPGSNQSIQFTLWPSKTVAPYGS